MPEKTSGPKKTLGIEDVRLPSDAAEAKRLDRLANGIPMMGGLYEGLSQVAVDLGVEGLE